jgi:CheY-like chemotaxis protein
MAKILVVEDDQLMSRVYEKLFSFENYEVFIAKDGAEGLSMAQQQLPTVILLDIMMPKMNGFQVLASLKQNPATSKIPVIILTNLAGKADAEEALTKGAVRYIIKSEQDPTQVVAIVKEIIAGATRNEVPTTSQ